MKKMMTIAMCAAAAVAMAAEPAAPAPAAAAPAPAPAAQPAPAPAAQPAKKQGFRWRWWVRDEDKTVDATGCVLAIASSFQDVTGAQINFLWGTARDVKAGYQGAWGYSEAKTLRNGCQVAFVNKADLAALQIGLINFNKEGFVPVFPFFNFSKKGFGKAK